MTHMKLIFKVLLSASTLTLYSALFAASENANNRTTSCSTAASSSSEQQHPATEGKGKWLTLKRTIYVPSERGQEIVQARVKLSSVDHLSKQTFYDHIIEDAKRSLPWILALLNYEREDGTLARDYADGRYWHEYLVSSEPTVHPLYNGLLIGSPEYYSVEIKDKKLVTAFLGTEKVAALPNPDGRLLSLFLAFEQNGNVLGDIGFTYFNKGNWDKTIEWSERALPVLQKEQRPYSFVLQNLGSAYSKKSDWDKTIEWFERALPVLQKEKQTDSSPLNDLGFAHENKGNIAKACFYYVQASEQRDAGACPLINILFVQATHIAQCPEVSESQMQCYAQRLLDMSHDQLTGYTIANYKNKYPERYAVAHQEAERLLGRQSQQADATTAAHASSSGSTTSGS